MKTAQVKSAEAGSGALHLLSAAETAVGIREQKFSPVEVVEAALARMDARNDALNAVVTRVDDAAREAAQRAEKIVRDKGETGPLHGVPMVVKDLFDPVAGVRNTFGCRVFADFVPGVNATYVQRLTDAGAILVGKTNTPEFGHKGVTDNLLFGPTRNPFDPARNSGGSSGGSAVAVAEGMAPLAQGSDGGGSIRIPAAHCGVVGFKPSFGRIAAAARPDAFLHTPFIHVGPLARTVEDAALMAAVMSGPHPDDPFSVPGNGSLFTGARFQSTRGLRVGWSPGLGDFPVEPEVREVCARAVGALAGAGLHADEIKLRLGGSHEALTELWLNQISVLYAATAENFKAMGVDLLGDHRAELCPEFAALIERGSRISAVEAKLFDVARTAALDGLQAALSECDVVVSPTLSVPPIKNANDGSTLGPAVVDGRPVERTIGWCLTHPINFTGHPAISVPAGLTPDGLPVGLQIIGRRYCDDTVLAVAATLERVRPWLNDLPAFARH